MRLGTSVSRGSITGCGPGFSGEDEIVRRAVSSASIGGFSAYRALRANRRASIHFEPEVAELQCRKVVYVKLIAAAIALRFDQLRAYGRSAWHMV
jgi:hypothetical protein